MLDFIFQIFLELGLFVFSEFLGDLGLRSTKEVFRPRQFRNPLLAGLGCLLFGAAVGLGSLLPFPRHFIRNPRAQIGNLVATPLMAGLIMWLIGKWRSGAANEMYVFDDFLNGWLFALGMGLTRYLFAQ